MKLDESMPHLRAAAVIYADVQADELVRYFEDGACDKRKSFLTTIPPSFAAQNPPPFRHGRL